MHPNAQALAWPRPAKNGSFEVNLCGHPPCPYPEPLTKTGYTCIYMLACCCVRGPVIRPVANHEYDSESWLIIQLSRFILIVPRRSQSLVQLI